MTRDTKTSWVETTLPPGYASTFLQGWTDLPEGYEYGWSSGEAERWGFTETHERNRAAWRHWTAAVLRGRDVVWEDDGAGTTASWLGDVMIARDEDVAGAPYWVSVFTSSARNNGYHQELPGVDEAMARFAFLVAGIHGPSGGVK